MSGSVTTENEWNEGERDRESYYTKTVIKRTAKGAKEQQRNVRQSTQINRQQQQHRRSSRWKRGSPLPHSETQKRSKAVPHLNSSLTNRAPQTPSSTTFVNLSEQVKLRKQVHLLHDTTIIVLAPLIQLSNNSSLSLSLIHSSLNHRHSPRHARL